MDGWMHRAQLLSCLSFTFDRLLFVARIGHSENQVVSSEWVGG